MRCAGFDRVDVKNAKTFGMSVARVPAYSPYAVAEHAIALFMSVNRRITSASARVKMGDFTLDSSLLGMDIHGKTIGVSFTFLFSHCFVIAYSTELSPPVIFR